MKETFLGFKVGDRLKCTNKIYLIEVGDMCTISKITKNASEYYGFGRRFDFEYIVTNKNRESVILRFYDEFEEYFDITLFERKKKLEKLYLYEKTTN